MDQARWAFIAGVVRAMDDESVSFVREHRVQSTDRVHM